MLIKLKAEWFITYIFEEIMRYLIFIVLVGFPKRNTRIFLISVKIHLFIFF